VEVCIYYFIIASFHPTGITPSTLQVVDSESSPTHRQDVISLIKWY